MLAPILMKEIGGHLLNIGDSVKMNIKAIGEGDLDGVEFTSSGFNYWRYMNQHPDEVYTVVGVNLSEDEPQYELSGAMGGNNWYSDELILVPAPASVFELIKNMTMEEMKANLFPMMMSLCEDGVPSPEEIERWLNSRPETELNKENENAEGF